MSAKTRNLTIVALTVAATLAALPAAAALVPAECQGAADVGSCGLQSLVNVFVLFANYIFGIAGSLAFVFLIYGGYVWLSSAGSSEKIKQGQTIIVNAIIGLMLIFGARGIVGLVITAITKGANVPIEGGSCKPPTALPAGSPISPRYMADGEGKLVCVASCDDLKTVSGKKYKCMDPTDGTDCQTKLCEGGSDNVCCIDKPLSDSKDCTCDTPYGSFSLPLPGSASSCSEVTCAYSEGSHYCACGQAKLPYDDMVALQFTEEEFAAYCSSIKNCR